MTKYNGQIQNVLQGVSQQPQKERRPEQLTSQINCLSSVIDGLGKRPGTRGLGRFGLTEFPSGEDTAFYSYDRGDTQERYLMGIGNSKITVIDLNTGLEEDVVYTAATAYLNSSKPKDAIRFHTISDTTFILNNTKIPATKTPSPSADAWQALVYCKRANWGKDYKVIVGGTTVAEYTTPATVTLSVSSTTQEANKAATVKTTEVIDGLLAPGVAPSTAIGLTAWASANGVTLTQFEDVVHLHKAAGTYAMASSDDSNGADLFIIGELYSNYANLPQSAPDGYKVNITGIDKSITNDYYVAFQTDMGNTIGRGSWEESIGFGVDTEFDATLMPHKLVREADGKFYFRENEWDIRAAGDDDSNPIPSFVGETISNVISYQGRLVLTTEESQCASVTFEYFNFWANSVTIEAADDPIDTASSDNQVTNLHHTLVFNSSLVSFSDKAQFVHPGEAAFSSETFSLASKIRFANNVACAPVASATSIFFAHDFGTFTGIRELTTESITGRVGAESVTDHCKKFIRGSALQIASSTDYNLLCVRTDDTDSPLLHIYEWFDRGNERVQSSWHTWDFNAPIIYMNIIQDKLYGILDRGSDFSLGYVDLADQDSNGCTFPIRLDLMEELQSTSSGDNWVITPTITGFSTIDLGDLKVIAGDFTQLAGTAVGATISGSTLLISKDTVDAVGGTPKFFVGLPYGAEAEITNPYVRDQNGQPKTHGSLKLASMQFNVAETGYIEFVVENNKGETFTLVYDTRIINDSIFVLDSPPTLVNAGISVPIRTARNRCTITIKSDSHLPFNVSDIDWSGTYHESGRRTV